MLEAAKNILYMYCFSEFEGSAGVIDRGYLEAVANAPTLFLATLVKGSICRIESFVWRNRARGASGSERKT